MDSRKGQCWATKSEKKRLSLKRAAVLALSSRGSVRLFGFLVVAFSIAQLVLLGHPSLAPPPVDTRHPGHTDDGVMDYAARPYASRTIVSERSRLVYCPVPKVANTNWKYLIRKWEGLADFGDLTRAHLPARSGLRYLSDYSPHEARAIVRAPRFFKFAFVRDPFRRTLSAYMDKFRNQDPRYMREEYRAFLAALLGWRVARAVDVRYAPRPSFKDFVDALTPAPRPAMNAHWRPQTLLCGFGEMPYDFVGRMENLAEDAQYVFRKLNRSEEHFPSHEEIGFPPSGASADLVEEMYTPDLRNKVRRIYAEDFRVLGYAKE